LQLQDRIRSDHGGGSDTFVHVRAESSQAGLQHFNGIGSRAFFGQADQRRLEQNRRQNHALTRGDIDGHGTSDIEVMLMGPLLLSASNLILSSSNISCLQDATQRLNIWRCHRHPAVQCAPRLATAAGTCRRCSMQVAAEGIRHLGAIGSLRECTVAVPPATLRAIANLLPDVFPLLTPLERSTTDHAGFGGAINVMGHPVLKDLFQHDGTERFAVGRWQDGGSS
jgi:hypothetical protein